MEARAVAKFIRMSPYKFKSKTLEEDFKPRALMAQPDFFPDEATGLPSDTPS